MRRKRRKEEEVTPLASQQGCTDVPDAAWLVRANHHGLLLGLGDPAKQCKLFDTLVLPILSYACEVWGVSPSVGEAAEVLHRGFLKHLLGVRISTTNEIVLAEFGRFPLQIQFWQQILRYHHRTVALDNTRLVKLAI